MSIETTRNGNSSISGHGADGDHVVDLHLVASPRWAALDLDELLEQLVLAGFPAELICTYTDPGGRRRYVRRYLRRNRKAVVA